MFNQSHQLRSPEQWQQLIEQQARSSLTQAAFCTSQGLAKTTFQHWKRRLKAASRATVSTAPALRSDIGRGGNNVAV